jgi:hypothetical protein
VEQSCLPHNSQEAEKEEEGARDNIHFCKAHPKLATSSSNQALLPNSPFSREFISGLIIGEVSNS